MFKPLVFQKLEVAMKVALEQSRVLNSMVHVIFDSASEMHFVDLNPSITIPTETLICSYLNGEIFGNISTEIIEKSST